MYGKFGRGGGGQRGGGSGGGSKRNSFPLSHQRLPSTSRPSLSSRKPSSTPPPQPPPPPSQTDESFSLVSGDPPAFAAIIRLAPDLVDEIKRAESNGGDARIKFDSNPSNSSGNIIDVDGKEFRFTWSQETGGLCDIYEERQNAVDGNGLLVESGCLLRKLNVQRVLDESTKKQVKRRSEEYEQKQKSRKAIVLDQCNPSMKKQMQDLAAAEVNPWKFKQKNKRYFEPQQVGNHPKPVKPTTGSTIATNAKARRSTSPLPSPQNQPISLTSAFVKGNAMESQTVLENTANIQGRAKENFVGSENDYVSQVSDRMQEAAVHRDKQGVGKLDLQNLLVTLLKDNPKGMSLKALEKAEGDMTSSSARKMEPILKKIATYEPPGRYVLKSGVELENLKRSYSDSGSSPEDNNTKQFIPEDNYAEVPAPETDYAGKSPDGDQTENTQKFDHESNIVEKFDASQHFSDLFGDDEPPEQIEGRAAKSNDSGSDSDSDSGSSDSASRSRSRSLAGSGSASSSDSDGNDSSANSKEASDVDVDIMSNDDKEPKKLQGTEPELTTAPVLWNMPGAVALQGGINGNQDGYASEDVDIDIENDYLDDNEAHLATGTHNISVTTQNLRTVSPDHDQNQQTNRTVVHEREDIEDESQYEHQKSITSASKSKRGFKGIPFENEADHVKRFKSNTVQPSNSRNTGSRSLGSPLTHSDHGIKEDNETRNLQMSNQLNKDGNASTLLGTKKRLNSFSPGKSAAESLQSGRRPPARSYNTETTDKAFKNPPNLGIQSKFPETNAYTQESFPLPEEKGYRDADYEEDSSTDKANGKVSESPLQKHSWRPEPHRRKPSEWDKRSHLGTVTRPSLKDNGKAAFDGSPADKKRLHRELSDLELGELREPSTERPEGTKRQQVERVGSFKQSDTKLGNSGSQNAELKSMSKPVIDSSYTSPSNARGAPNNSDSSSRRSLEPYAEDSSCPDGASQPQLQQSRNGHAKVGSMPYKAVNHDRLVQNETVGNQGTDVEGYGETQKKSHITSRHEESRQDIGSHKGKGNKSKKSNGSKDASDSRRNGSNARGRKEKRKRSESSSEENISFTKYEKEEPEFKESINSFSQYKDYVQEYKEKYESYCSLHKILETYKNEFQKLGTDLDAAKGGDKERYHEILSQLRERYSRCGTRHTRLKKIFLVLHEELKHLKQMIKDFAADYTRE